MIRTATVSDAPAIAAISRSARAAAMPWLPVLHSVEGDLTFFTRAVTQYHVEVAEVDGAVAGFIALDDDWVDHLYIAPAHQGKGLGSALLTRAKARADFLQLWVFQQNIAAQGFYAKHGFAEVERTDGSTNEERCPDLRMTWHHA